MTKVTVWVKIIQMQQRKRKKKKDFIVSILSISIFEQFSGSFSLFLFFFKSGILRGSSVCSDYTDQQGSLSHVCFCFSFCLESLQSGILFHLICLYIKSSGKSRGYHLCSACIYHINHNWGAHVLNPNCLSVMWMLSVSLVYQSLSRCLRCGGLGAVKYAVSVNYPSRQLLFIKLYYSKCVRQTKWKLLPSPLNQMYP